MERISCGVLATMVSEMRGSLSRWASLTSSFCGACMNLELLLLMRLGSFMCTTKRRLTYRD